MKKLITVLMAAAAFVLAADNSMADVTASVSLDATLTASISNKTVTAVSTAFNLPSGVQTGKDLSIYLTLIGTNALAVTANTWTLGLDVLNGSTRTTVQPITATGTITGAATNTYRVTFAGTNFTGATAAAFDSFKMDGSNCVFIASTPVAAWNP